MCLLFASSCLCLCARELLPTAGGLSKIMSFYKYEHVLDVQDV